MCHVCNDVCQTTKLNDLNILESSLRLLQRIFLDEMLNLLFWSTSLKRILSGEAQQTLQQCDSDS